MGTSKSGFPIANWYVCTAFGKNGVTPTAIIYLTVFALNLFTCPPALFFCCNRTKRPGKVSTILKSPLERVKRPLFERFCVFIPFIYIRTVLGEISARFFSIIKAAQCAAGSARAATRYDTKGEIFNHLKLYEIFWYAQRQQQKSICAFCMCERVIHAIYFVLSLWMHI